MGKKIFFLFFIVVSILQAKNLVSDINVTNKPPYVNNDNIIVASYPDSKITITLNAIDPEGNGVYAILNNSNIGDGIKCSVKNAIQIVCSIPNLVLTKNDFCYVNTVNGKVSIPYCKSFNISYYLKDGGYENLPPAVSQNYNITLRVSKEINSTTVEDYRGYGNTLKSNFAVSNYNVNTIGKILPKSLQEQYNIAVEADDKNNLLNNKIINNSEATNAMKNAISGTKTNYFLNKADTITTGTAVSGAPIYCTIKRVGLFKQTAYVCSLDPMLSVNPDLATMYSYNSGDSVSQNAALQQCQSACKEQVECNDESGEIFYDLIKDKNYITIDTANQNQSDKNSSVKELVIEKRTPDGKLISTKEIPIENLTLKDFYWNNGDFLKTIHVLNNNLELDCDFRSDLDIQTYVKGDSFYIVPQSTCYIKYQNVEYPGVDDSNLYTFKLLYNQPRYVCPLGEDYIVYNDKEQCAQHCYYQGECLTVENAMSNFDEHIVNNCKDVVLSNGELLSDAVAAKQCRLVNEVSLNDDGSVRKYFVQNGVVVDPLRDDIGFSQDPSILHKENAIEMVGSFLNMVEKGKDEERLSKISLPKDLIGFDGEIKNKNFDYLASIYKEKDSNASASIMLKVNPKLVNEIKNGDYKDADYAMLPVVLLVTKQKMGEKEKYLKTYYLLNFNDFNASLNGGNVEEKKSGVVSVALGKIGDDYWHGYCKIYELSTSFYITNVNDVNSFILKDAYFDDYIEIILNGHVVYVGPYGGTMLKVEYATEGDNIIHLGGWVRYDKDKTGACELSTSWRKHPDIDVKQYLKNGLNTVDIRVEVTGGGEGYVFFDANLSDINAFKCASEYCSIKNSNSLASLDATIHTPRIIDEFLYLNRDAVITRKDNAPFDPNNLLFKLSDGSWGITPKAYKDYKNYLDTIGLKYTIITPDFFLNNSFNKYYFELPYTKSIVGVTDFEKLINSYNEYKANENKYFEKDRSFNKYSIEMDNNFNIDTVYVSDLARMNPFTSEQLEDLYTGAYKNVDIKYDGFIPIEEEFGDSYDPKTLKVANAKKWTININDISNLDSYVKNINIWDDLRRGNLLLPQWIGLIDFNSFGDGKLFLIVDKKKNIEDLINNIKQKGVDYLINLLENDYVDGKKYLAWNMNDRYENSLIYDGNETYSGIDATNVNKFIRLFGLHFYDVLCPEGFIFNGNSCVLVQNNNIHAAAFPDYFSNELEQKNGPLYASYDKGTLFIREVPPMGTEARATSIICPDGYSYNEELKECVKYGNIKDCTALNGNYDFDIQACIAEPKCSNGGFFDSFSGKCIKLTPSNYTGENGYYFVYEDEKDNYKFFTPLSTPEKYQCVYQQYKCPISGEIFNSKSACDLLCYKLDSQGNKIYSKCSFIGDKKESLYNDYDSCKYQCVQKESSFNWYGTLYIKNETPFNKYSQVIVYLNGKEIKNAVSLQGDNLVFGSDGILRIPNVKPGDVVQITFISRWTGLQYGTGVGYWNDSLGDKIQNVSSYQCFELSKYYKAQNIIDIGLDVSNDGIYDSQLKIPTFYCVSQTPFSKTITINILKTGLDVKYYDDSLISKESNSKLEFDNAGICVSNKDNSSNIVPYFENMLDADYLNNADISTLECSFAPDSYYGLKGDVDRTVVESFKKHFCHYPLQEEYDLAKGAKTDEDLKSIFFLYKYYDQCPDYFNSGVKLLRLSTDDNKKAVYKLGIEKVDKKYFDLSTYNPEQIYNAINKEKIVTLPVARGVYMDDNFFIKIPNIGNKVVYVGYGYSPYDDCRSLDGKKVSSEIVTVPKTDCNFKYGTWKYDPEIRKCVSIPTNDGCVYGYYINGKCELDPKCPYGYVDINGKCEKILITTYTTDRKICKPWWTLRREYVCDGLNGLLDGYTFGLPRWITIEQVPIYRYKEYNFYNNK